VASLKDTRPDSVEALITAPAISETQSAVETIPTEEDSLMSDNLESPNKKRRQSNSVEENDTSALRSNKKLKQQKQVINEPKKVPAFFRRKSSGLLKKREDEWLPKDHESVPPPITIRTRRTSKAHSEKDDVPVPPFPLLSTGDALHYKPDEHSLEFRFKPPSKNNIVAVNFETHGWCLGIIKQIKDLNIHVGFWDGTYPIEPTAVLETLDNPEALVDIELDPKLKAELIKLPQYSSLYE